MLPNDILNIVQIYNESGIFVRIGEATYWCKHKNEIITYENDFSYFKTESLKIYKNKKFNQISFDQNNAILNMSRFRVIANGFVYRMEHGQLEKFDGINLITMPQKQFPRSGYRLVYYTNNIYVFGHLVNEKFNVLTQKWTQFQVSDPFFYSDIYLFQDKFYAFIYQHSYQIYDPEKDEWEIKVR